MSTHSNTDALVRMANQIGKFFHVQGEQRTVVGVADHVRKYWEPRMKKEIFDHLDRGGAGLDPLTLKGLQKLKADMHGKTTAAEAKAAAEACSKTAGPAQAGKSKAAGTNGSKPKAARR